MKKKKMIYCSPKLEIVAFDEDDILTVSTHGGEDDGEESGEGTGGGINWGDLSWVDP